MTAIHFRAVGLVAVLAALGLLGTSGLTQQQNSPPHPTQDRQRQPDKREHSARSQRPDEEAIRKAFSDYVEAINKGDAQAMLSHWAQEADYTNEAGDVTHGKDAIEAMCKPAMPHLKGHKVTGRVLSVKFVRPDVALLDGELDFTDAQGNREATRLSSLWLKSGDRWLISCARELPGQISAEPSEAYAHLKQLEWLIGEWRGEGPKSGVGATCRSAPDKSFLIVDYTVERSAAEPKLVTLRIGWDPANQTLRSWVFDSLGGFGEGTWERDGNRWIVSSSGVLPDGGTASSTDAWEFKDENTYVWRSTDREVDGQPMPDVEVKFVRTTENATHKEAQP